MKDYEKLKQVIQAANPEIMELQFGCELDWENDIVSYVDQFKSGDGDDDFTYKVIHKGKLVQVWKVHLKVLGRPIRLADVLLAIASELPRSDSYFVDADGGFHEWFSPKGRLDLRTVAHWNLKEDDLSKQSEETIKFLTELLCPT